MKIIKTGLLLFIITLIPSIALCTSYVSNQTGNWNTTTVWTPNGTPGDGDTVTVSVGDTVTVTANATIGSNNSAVGDAVTVNGILTVSNAITLTLKGNDTTVNRAMYIAPGGEFSPADGSITQVELASDGQTIIKNEGDWISGACIVQAVEVLNWAAGGQTLSNYTMAKRGVSAVRNIGMFPLNQLLPSTGDSVTTKGVVSNLAVSSIGSSGDNSFSVVSITQPSLGFTNEVASFELLLATGDYYIDCNSGMGYYYDSQKATRLTLTYTVQMAQRYGFSIHSILNGASRFLADGTTFYRLGSKFSPHFSEFSEQGIFLRYRTNGVVDPTKEGKVTNCNFNYCIIPLQVYTSSNTISNPFNLTGNSYNYTVRAGGNFKANILLGFAEYIDCSGSSFDTVDAISYALRTPVFGVTMSNMTGEVLAGSIVPAGYGHIADSNDLMDTGTWADAGGFQVSGISGNPNIYTNNVMRYGNRCGRVGSFMTIQNNTFFQYTHHGFTGPGANGYYAEIAMSNNINGDSPTTGDFSGGWTLGYNYNHWLHDITVDNNTFDTGNRSIYLNDGEGTVVLGTKIKIRNNNLTNSNFGIYLPADDASNQTKMQIEHLDYNNEFNFTVPSNVNQGSFIQSATLYLSDSGNVPGVSVYNPSDAPNLVGRALELIVGAGSKTLSWGGGVAVELVDDTGTTTGGDANTLIDTVQTWTANEHRCKYAEITSGAAIGQFYMIISNTADTLELISNLASPVSIAASMTYDIVDAEALLTDTGANTVTAGIHLPDLPTANATYTDTGITIEYNGLTEDPQYTDVAAENYAPLNQNLKGAGYLGVDIGAVAVASPSVSGGGGISVGGITGFPGGIIVGRHTGF